MARSWGDIRVRLHCYGAGSAGCAIVDGLAKAEVGRVLVVEADDRAIANYNFRRFSREIKTLIN